MQNNASDLQTKPFGLARAASLALFGGLLTGLVIWEAQITLSALFGPLILANRNLEEICTFSSHMRLFLLGGALGLLTGTLVLVAGRMSVPQPSSADHVAQC